MKLFEQNGYKGGVIASRNNPKCYSKQNQKEIQSDNKLPFSGKHLSLETAHTLSGILKNLQNLLKIGTSGEISTSLGFESHPPTFARILDWVWV